MTNTKPTDSKLTFINGARVLTYLVYGFTMIAVTFLTFGFILLLFGANPQTPFVNFVYGVAQQFLEPFRGIFPLHQISANAYFSASALFAIVVYLFAAMALHSLISYVNLKKAQHEAELAELERQANRPVQPPKPHESHPADTRHFDDHHHPPHGPERV